MAIRFNKGCSLWEVYWNEKQPDGKQKRKAGYFPNTAAGKLAAEQKNKAMGFGRRKTRKKEKGPQFKDLAKLYYETKTFNSNSLKHLHIRLKANILPFFGQRYAMALTDDNMDAYVKQRYETGVKFATITRELTDVKAILNYAVSRRPPVISFNPVRDYKKPGEKDAEIVTPPTLAEAKRIEAAASAHLKRAIVLSFFTGLRPGSVELLSLKWSRVDFEAKTIQIISAHKGGPETRLVPLHEELVERLMRWRDRDLALEKQKNKKVSNKHKKLALDHIIHYHGRPIKKIQTSWAGALKRAKITRRIRPYDLRHFFVTKTLEGGTDYKTVAELVGSSPETIMRHYQHVTTDRHRRAVATMPSLSEKYENEKDPKD